MLNSGLAILAKNTIPEHTKRGVVAQILFCESSQSVTTRAVYLIQKGRTILKQLLASANVGFLRRISIINSNYLFIIQLLSMVSSDSDR